MDPRKRIIFALDVPTKELALSWVDKLHDHVGSFKVGLESHNTIGGPQIAKSVIGVGGGVFYDGKFHDIPNTVAGASKGVAALGVDFFNVHASGGVAMMKAAVANKGTSMVIAVTVLTSIGTEECELTYGASVKAKVLQFARDAVVAGCDGIVCSAQELEFLAGYPELDGLLRITPGIRLVDSDVGDQKRVMGPKEAIMARADYLVVGRDIAKAEDPVSVAQRYVEQVACGMEALEVGKSA